MIIYSGSSKILLSGPSDLVDKIISSSFVYHYIPAFSLTSKVKIRQEYTLELNNKNAKLSFQKQGKKFYLEGNLKKYLSLEDVITVLEYCLEYIRQEKGIYCVHGSAVAKQGKSILFIGAASGLGKTTLALNLCQQEGFDFIGDEKILVDLNNQLVGGSTFIIYNKKFLTKSIKINLNLKKIDYNSQIKLAKTPLRLSLIVQPMIFNSAVKLEIERWNNLKANFHFYEEITRKIRGTSRRINNFRYPLPSIDNEIIALKRASFANEIAQKVPFYQLRGNTSKIMGKISELLKQNF